jgi:hypothetical protein
MDENEKDFLKFYMEQSWEEMRHLEDLREKVTILVVTLATAITGFIMQQKFAIETKPFVWFLMILGAFGFLMTRKIFQLHQLAQRRLDKWYIYYESFCGSNPQILSLRNQADKESKADYFFISRLKHNHFWAIIHIFIVVAGLFLLTQYSNPIPQAKEHHSCCTQKIKDSTSKTIDTTKQKPKSYGK